MTNKKHEFIKEIFSKNAADPKKISKGLLDVAHDFIPLSQIMPTQITVGLRQVRSKQKKLRKLAHDPEKLLKFLLERPIPLVRGPKGKPYAIDHHHLGNALVRENFKMAALIWVADYSSLPKSAFWKKMEEMKYVHPHDENGRQRPFKAIPTKFSDLKDDPYRSLAGFARQNGAFEKVHIPYTEFRWADYFRKRIPPKSVVKDFGKALENAAHLACSVEAKDLPGYKIRQDSSNGHVNPVCSCA